MAATHITQLKQDIDCLLHDESKPWTQYFAWAEAKYGVDRLVLFSAGCVFVVILLFFGFAGGLLCNLIGFVYPAYASIHAVESEDKDDDKKWLTYWIVYGLFLPVESFVNFIVSWFPLYWLIKLLFMGFLMVPGQFNGSIFIYNSFVRPYFLAHHNSIDKSLNNIKDATKHHLK